MKKRKREYLAILREKTINLPEKDISIEFRYDKPIWFRRLLGVYTIEINGFIFKRALRFSDIDGNLPSLKSALIYPAILVEYIYRKISKARVVNNPKPFLVVDAVDYIRNFCVPKCKVLEVGAGNSTLWFLNNGCEVLSLEHNQDWAESIELYAEGMKGNAASRLTIEICQEEEAIRFMGGLKDRFDIILIDSMNEFISRYEAIKILKEKLSPKGILILDNSDGVVNWKAFAEMGGINRRKFSGYVYNAPYVGQTTIWHASDILSDRV